MRGLAVAMIVVFHCYVLSGSPVGARFHNFLGGMFLGVDLFFVLSGYLLALGWLPLRWLGVIGYSVFLWRLPLIFRVNQYPSVAALTGVAHYKKLLELVIPMVVVLGILGYPGVSVRRIAVHRPRGGQE